MKHNIDKYMGVDNDGEWTEKDIATIEIGVLSAIPHNKRNFFFAKNNPRIKYSGHEHGSIYIVRRK